MPTTSDECHSGAHKLWGGHGLAGSQAAEQWATRDARQAPLGSEGYLRFPRESPPSICSTEGQLAGTLPALLSLPVNFSAGVILNSVPPFPALPSAAPFSWLRFRPQSKRSGRRGLWHPCGAPSQSAVSASPGETPAPQLSVAVTVHTLGAAMASRVLFCCPECWYADSLSLPCGILQSLS